MSILMSLISAEAVLPAKSVTVFPVTLWLAPSADRVMSPGHVATPDTLSAHAKLTVTSVLFQPLAFAPGDREPLMVGGVASRLTMTLFDVVPPADVAVHVNVVPAVSVETVLVPHPDEAEIAEFGSVTLQDTLTLDVYQPLLPDVPVTVGVMTGGVVTLHSTAR